MIQYDQVKLLHIEFSTICNARCPLCPRNLYGFPFNGGYEETNLSLELVKNKLDKSFIQNLDKVLVNGNFGDFTANLESIEILKYFRSVNQNILISVSTNGSARNRIFWEELAAFDIHVMFCLDGLKDTHHLYRQDTDWDTIISNAGYFIAAGGRATWKMIKFAHNEHQITQCNELSKQLKFSDFQLIDYARDTGPVFNRRGKLIHSIGDPTKELNSIKNITQAKISLLGNHWENEIYDPSTQLNCESNDKKMIYISADGKVYPCCYLGFSPDTYTSGIFKFVNKQVKNLTTQNSLHENDLATCLNWFNKIEESWSKTNYNEGRMLQCDKICGKCKAR